MNRVKSKIVEIETTEIEKCLCSFFFNIISSQFSGFYTGWLFPAAVVGVLVFLYGVLTMNSNTIVVETCQHGDSTSCAPFVKPVTIGSSKIFAPIKELPISSTILEQCSMPFSCLSGVRILLKKF